MSDNAGMREARYKMKLLRQMERLSSSRVNDAVKLAYLDREQMDELDRLDLTALTEFKRSANGVEFKVINRLAVMEKLMEFLGGGSTERADAFFRALDQRTEGGEKGA